MEYYPNEKRDVQMSVVSMEFTADELQVILLVFNYVNDADGMTDAEVKLRDRLKNALAKLEAT